MLSSSLLVGAFLLVVAATFAAAATLLYRRHTRAWREFGQARGMELRRDPGLGTRLLGRLQGREVEVGIVRMVRGGSTITHTRFRVCTAAVPLYLIERSAPDHPRPPASAVPLPLPEGVGRRYVAVAGARDAGIALVARARPHLERGPLVALFPEGGDLVADVRGILVRAEQLQAVVSLLEALVPPPEGAPMAGDGR